jgi:hypothetical protein
LAARFERLADAQRPEAGEVDGDRRQPGGPAAQVTVTTCRLGQVRWDPDISHHRTLPPAHRSVNVNRIDLAHRLEDANG